MACICDVTRPSSSLVQAFQFCLEPLPHRRECEISLDLESIRRNVANLVYFVSLSLMAPDSVQDYQKLMVKANEYHKKALWQEKLRLLQEALAVCDGPGFPEADARRQELFYDVAGIWRRLGQYDRAKQMLQQSLDAFPGASSSFRASILGM